MSEADNNDMEQLRKILSHQGHLTKSGDTFLLVTPCRVRRGGDPFWQSHKRVEARNGAQYPSVHRRASHTKITGLKYQVLRLRNCSRNLEEKISVGRKEQESFIKELCFSMSF